MAAMLDAWHAAANAGDVEALVALAAEDVEVGGPRGSARGHALVREWYGRTAIRLRVLQTFADGDVAVVEQAAVWGAVEGAPEAVIATLFEARDGKFVRIVRYDTLSEALAAAGLVSG
jgi:ketosteroid isomerase-like protein